MLNRRASLLKTVSFCATLSVLAFSPLDSTNVAFANVGVNALQPIQAQVHLGAEWMQGPHHRVLPTALSDGRMIIYTIVSREGETRIKGTAATREFIREVAVTEVLRDRSTAGAMLGATKKGALNLVETPVRVVKSVAGKVGKIDSVGEAVLFVPKETVNVAGGLLDGVGELLVTGKRITTGVAGTRCSGTECFTKAGRDVWSGLNSITGKHGVAQELHNEFGTDSETRNKAYRRQIDRIAYADSYTGTVVEFGAGNAGVQYLSATVVGVGYYDNGEFVTGYQDAYRRRNYEKDQLVSWGLDRQQVEAFYKSKVFTKKQRDRFFLALEAINNNEMRRRLFQDAASIDNYSLAKGDVIRADYIAAFDRQKAVNAYAPNGPQVSLIANNGTRVIPIYADYLDESPALTQNIFAARGTGFTEIHVLGKASQRLIKRARTMGVRVIEVTL